MLLVQDGGRVAFVIMANIRHFPFQTCQGVLQDQEVRGKDGAMLPWPAKVFNHQLFLPAED